MVASPNQTSASMPAKTSVNELARYRNIITRLSKLYLALRTKSFLPARDRQGIHHRIRYLAVEDRQHAFRRHFLPRLPRTGIRADIVRCEDQFKRIDLPQPVICRHRLLLENVQ